MVDIHGKSYSDIIKIKGTDKKIDLTKLEGLQRTEQNKAIFDMVDHNKDGVIDRNEAQSLQGTLLTTSNGNGILSKREANKHYGEQMNAFEAISALADQQKAIEMDPRTAEQIVADIVENGKTEVGQEQKREDIDR
jgi:predicted NodU family carbamoyl transferase